MLQWSVGPDLIFLRSAQVSSKVYVGSCFCHSCHKKTRSSRSSMRVRFCNISTPVIGIIFDNLLKIVKLWFFFFLIFSLFYFSQWFDRTKFSVLLTPPTLQCSNVHRPLTFGHSFICKIGWFDYRAFPEGRGSFSSCSLDTCISSGITGINVLDVHKHIAGGHYNKSELAGRSL